MISPASFAKRRNHVHGFILMVVTVVMIAGFKRIFQFAIQISLEHIIYLALASSDDCDAVGRKLVVGSHAHVASQHEGDAHLLHDRCYVRFASASFRRIQTLLFYNLVLFAECYYGIIGSVTEVVINHAITCQDCN